MLGINTDDLILLTVKYSQDEHISNRILMEGSKENIKLYFKNTRKNSFEPLSAIKIEEIRQAHPHKVKILVEKAQQRMGIGLMTETVPEYAPFLGVNDLWISNREVGNFIKAGIEVKTGVEQELEEISRAYKQMSREIQIKTKRLYDLYVEYYVKCDQTTRPIQDVIQANIVKKYGTGKEEAEFIDKYIRPDKFKGGGNRPRKQF